MSRSLLRAMSCVAVVVLATGADVGAADDVAERVVRKLQERRAAAGLAALSRRGDLDAVARDRAREIAALPHAQRLAYGKPIGDSIQEAGIDWYRHVVAHLDMVRGYQRPEIGILSSWRSHESAWAKAMGTDFDALGAASHRADDGWVVFVAVLLDEMTIPRDLPLLERETVAAVNRVRREHGLRALLPMERLTTVARSHSEDMVRRGFVGHVNPDGMGAAERVDLAGVPFSKIGENIQMSRGVEDPVDNAVRSWMSSKGHRGLILDPEFVSTGVGVAVAPDGSLHFTQLFLR